MRRIFSYHNSSSFTAATSVSLSLSSYAFQCLIIVQQVLSLDLILRRPAMDSPPNLHLPPLPPLFPLSLLCLPLSEVERNPPPDSKARRLQQLQEELQHVFLRARPEAALAQGFGGRDRDERGGRGESARSNPLRVVSGHRDDLDEVDNVSGCGKVR